MLRLWQWDGDSAYLDNGATIDDPHAIVFIAPVGAILYPSADMRSELHHKQGELGVPG